jgi:hypothetical protein
MEMSRQLHSSTVLLPRTELPARIGKEAAWSIYSAWILWRREKSVSLPGIEILSFGREDRSLVTTLIELH